MGRVAKAAMACEQRANADGEKRTRRTRVLHNLELQHQKNECDSDILVKDEDIRRLRVRILLLRDENTALRDQVDLNNGKNATLASRCDNLTAQIEDKIALVRSQEEQLRKQEREFSNLKAELQSMNNINENSANLLSEKLALARELANLKPEIEHLRSQVNQQQATLTEKLSLERQVDTLEVELANEKKATRRAMQNRESNDRVEDELRKKLRETEKQLTAEKAERERLEDQLEQKTKTHAITLQDQNNTREVEADLRKKLQEAQRQLKEQMEEKEKLEEEIQKAQRASNSQKVTAQSSADAELHAQIEEFERQITKLEGENKMRQQEHETAVAELEALNEQLEKKLEKARIKLRGTQEELKQSQNNLLKAQQQQNRLSRLDETKPAAKTQAFRKRKAQETSAGDFTNIEIQTPSAEDAPKARRAMKKIVFEPTVVGEKSNFSITPFLNRSKNTSMSEEASNIDEGVLEDSILGPQSGSEPTESSLSETNESSITKPVETTEAEPATTAPVETEKPQVVPKVRGRPKKVLVDAPSAKKNALTTKKAPKKILKTKSSLEKITETDDASPEEKSEDSGDAEPREKTTTVKFNLAPSHDEGNDSSQNGEIPKKKKRKVLGSTKTLFDEDEGEAPAARKPAKMQLGAKRAKAPLGVQKNAFAGTTSFSPLKRDRRGVGASFLA
ncbi:hypothetical protein F5B22DRAFT_594886 [Xylaria bambusicola]|uniref:uncharacterized protein n=1 Tax=Xylaria bambusicola TaxID=326684 RepID=UPI002008BF17|nr:uncharacterized protein F5B22DRAFT_594886 [Xylaria bambusicola]KAI0521971.1 hypothetical protein F5B22DRAFT_594886 [Xylaria bambusicola]